MSVSDLGISLIMFCVSLVTSDMVTANCLLTAWCVARPGKSRFPDPWVPGHQTQTWRALSHDAEYVWTRGVSIHHLIKYPWCKCLH